MRKIKSKRKKDIERERKTRGESLEERTGDISKAS